MFEEQFGNQISEFARAKIALEEERARINRLDRIATETRRREAELYDVRLKQEQQRAEAAQMALDQAKLEQKHTSAIASAWAAMTQEGNLNEVRAVKGRGTGKMVFDDPMTGLRTTYELDPSGQTTRTSEGIKEGEATRETEAFKDYGPAKPSNEAALKYQAAIAAAAAEAPGAIKTFADITQALANATNAPEHAKLANEYMRTQIDYLSGKGKGVSGVGAGTYATFAEANAAAVSYNHGWDTVLGDQKYELPEEVNKRETERVDAARARLAGSMNEIANLLGTFSKETTLAEEARRLEKALTKAATLKEIEQVNVDYEALMRKSIDSELKVAQADSLVKFREPILKAQAAYRQNLDMVYEMDRTRAEQVDIARSRYDVARAVYSEEYERTRGLDPVGAAKSTKIIIPQVFGEVAQVWDSHKTDPAFTNYLNLPPTASPQEENDGLVKLLTMYDEDIKKITATRGTWTPEQRGYVRSTLRRLATDARARQRTGVFVRKPTQAYVDSILGQ